MRAHTTYANTPDSDQQEFVEHTVIDDKGVYHQVKARDPVHAIELVRQVDKLLNDFEEWQKHVVKLG
jgi:hypothetical protein